MASGAVVVVPHREIPPGANVANFDTRASPSSPALILPVRDFTPAGFTYIDFLCELVGYDDGGLTWRIKWMASSASTLVTRWEGAIRRFADDGDDIDVSHTYDFATGNIVEATAATASGNFAYDNLTMASGADMDSLANNEAFIFRLRRNGDHANDTMAGDAELVSVLGLET